MHAAKINILWELSPGYQAWAAKLVFWARTTMKPPVLTLSSIYILHTSASKLLQSHTWQPKLSICVLSGLRTPLEINSSSAEEPCWVCCPTLVNASAKSMFDGVWQYNKLSPKNLEYQKLNSASIGGCWAYLIHCFTPLHQCSIQPRRKP